LGKEDGGEGERVLLDALVGWEQRGEAAAPFLIVGKAFVDLSSLLSLQTLRDKREGLLQYNSTRGW
jgi:hypothetical protein